MTEDPTFLPVPGAWRPVRDGSARIAALAKRIGLARATASLFTLPGNPHLATDKASAVLRAVVRAPVAPCNERTLAAFANAHPRPVPPGPGSGATVAMTSCEMGRTGLPLDAAWRRVTARLERDRGGPSTAEVRQLEGATFVLVRDSLCPATDPRGLRALYAWRSAVDGPALGRTPQSEAPEPDPAPPDDGGTPTSGGPSGPLPPSPAGDLSRNRRFMASAS
jgi:hypothetical protein